MALLYRHSPTYVGNRSKRANAIAHEPSLRACESCALTTVSPISLPMDLPASPPGYCSTTSLPSPTSSDSSLSKKDWRSHDHPTIFVRCAGYVALSATKTKTLQRRGGLDAGVGVSFVTPESRYDLSEPVPASLAAGDKGLRSMAVTPNRAEVFAAIRALDRVKGILAAACRDRSEGGWEAALGGMHVGGKRRMAPGTSLPGKVEEIVVLTRSEYLVNSITAPTSQKPWRLTPAGLRRFPAAYFPTTQCNPSVTSVSSLLTRSSSSSERGERRRRAWLSRKSKTARKADYDLFFELDLLVEDLASRYGVRVCFHKALSNEATRLAKKGASREGEEC